MAPMPDTSGPAFPVHGGYGADIDDPRNRILGGGLTKREYFSIEILASFQAGGVPSATWFDVRAKAAVAQADALIAALKE